MSAKKKSSPFKGFVHFMSGLGVWDSLVFLCTTLGSLALGRETPNAGLSVLFSICGFVFYLGIAILTRPPDEEPESDDNV